MKFIIASTDKQRPSGVWESQDGKYKKWKCSISSMGTFADVPKFEKILKEFGGSEERLVKEFTTKKVKIYLAAGYTPDQIKQLTIENDYALPPLDKKTKAPKSENKANTFEEEVKTKLSMPLRAKRSTGRPAATMQDPCTGETITVASYKAAELAKKRLEKETQKKLELESKPKNGTYPWQLNPNYFKSPAAPINIEEMSQSGCIYPNRYLDVECRECSIYDKCKAPLKKTEVDWNKPRRENSNVIKRLQSFTDEEIKAAIGET